MERNSYRYFSNSLSRPAQASESESSDESGPVTLFHTHRESPSEHSATYILRLFGGDEPPTPQVDDEFEYNHPVDSDSSSSGDWNYDRHTGGQRNDSEWDEIDDTQEQRSVPRSFWAQSFVDARSEVRRLFLYAIIAFWADTPDLDAEAAWTALVAKFHREAVFEYETDVIDAWRFAFNEPARAHFHSLYGSSLTAIRALW